MHGVPSRAQSAVDPRASAGVLSFCRARLQSCNWSKYVNDHVAAPVEELGVDEVVKSRLPRRKKDALSGVRRCRAGQRRRPSCAKDGMARLRSATLPT